MIEYLIFGSVIIILLVSGVYLFKILLKDIRINDTNVSTQIRSIGQPTIEPTRLEKLCPAQINQNIEKEYIDDYPAIKAKSKSIKYVVIRKLIFLLFAIGLGYSFKDNLHAAFASLINKTNVPKKESPLLSQGNTMSISGVNWHKIIATDSQGLQFSGWVSEFSIKEAPPKPSKTLGMVDKLRKDIGLPTTQEQVESIKNFKKVSGSLKETMDILRKQSKN